jgi:hypothetical protein
MVPKLTFFAGRYGKLTQELLTPISAFPDLFGAISLVHVVVKTTVEISPLPGVPGINTCDMFMFFDENCKLLRVGDDSLRSPDSSDSDLHFV